MLKSNVSTGRSDGELAAIQIDMLLTLCSLVSTFSVLEVFSTTIAAEITVRKYSLQTP